ncbi:hypothetical protein [Halomarina litorea]|uniref:hypothetical protein n=1 Tax=Halomarina litorea TaxID=2961595 RepID=UPI0020C3E8F1|nr:hypothetical protein [Halomarina sp. BCD28]
MRVLLDATTLIALGAVGELDLLTNFDGEIEIPHLVYEEVTTEPARSALDRFTRPRYESGEVRILQPTAAVERGCKILGDEEPSGDAQIVGRVATAVEEDVPVAVVSDDRRVRTVTRGLDATVTGTIGVVTRAVEEGMDPKEAKDLVRRLDGHGLHTTGELREVADSLIDGAADGR